MDNFNESLSGGYNKKEVNDFVDYVIKKTEENIDLIKSQQEELSKKDEIIKQLEESLKTYKKLENSYEFLEKRINEEQEKVKRYAEKEASLIIKEAKDNASKIINEALLEASRVEKEKEALNRSIKAYRSKIKSALMEQLEIFDNIEII